MKKKNLTKLTILMMILPYFTILPQVTFAEETESSVESTDTNEEKTQLSEEQIQQINEEFSIPTLKKNQKKETNEETIFEVEDGSVEHIKMGPLSIEEDRNTRASSSIRYTPIHIPIGANQEIQEKAFKQGSIIYFGDNEVRHEEIDFLNYRTISNSTKVDLREETLVTNSGVYDGIEVMSNQLAYSSKFTYGNYMGSLRNYKYVTNYGETVEIAYPANSNNTLSFTLHEREGNSYSGSVSRPDGHFLTVNSPSGGDNDFSVYDSSRPNEELMILEIYGSEKNISLGYDPLSSMVVTGNTRKSDVISFFNRSNIYYNNAILRIYSKDHGAIKKYEYNNGDKPKGPSSVTGYNDDDNIFFEFNKGKISKASSSIKIAPTKKLETNNNRKIGRGASDEYMKETIDEFFTNNQDYNITAADMTYVESPETNKLGKQTTDVTVLEYDEKTDKKWKQTYTIPYEVVSDSGPQMSTKTRDIKLGTTKSELDASIEESFEESSLNNVEYDEMEFVTYPDTNSLGKQTGKIKVINEKSAQGNKIDRTYEVDFNVFEPKADFTIETKEVDIPLGINADDINPRDFISSVSFEGRKLKENEYDVEMAVPPFTNYVGVDDEVDIKVTLKEDDSVSEIVTSTARVLWANTLLSKDMSESKQPIMTAISLLNHNSKPKLQMTYGLFEDNRFRSRNKIDIYRENSTNELLSIEQPVGYTTTAKLMKEWQPKLDKVNLEYGDVLKQRTSDYSNTPFNGKGTFVTRDEKLVVETTNYPDAYYELTDKGYHLLQLNQLGIKNDILEFNQNTPDSVVNEQAITAIEFPSHINDKTKFRFQLENVDTSKPGKYKAKINIYEKLTSGGEFMISKSVDYVVNEIPVSVELKEVEIPVGTKQGFLDPNSYVKKVVKNGKELNASEYTASFEKAPTTSKVGKSETTIKITTKEDNNSIVEKTNTKILWGDTVGSSLDGTSKTPIDASISMLHDQKKPYLVANEGTGLAVDASSGTYINVYQKSEDNAGRIFYVNPYYPKGDARKTMEVFNKAFDEQEFNYGDVIVYETRNEEEVGLKLWASRDEELIKESVGYNKSFYEMTEDGYRLLKANQLVVNDKLLSVPLNITHDEMNKKAVETVVFPKEVDAKDFRFEFASVDTASSGKKKTKLNIYEKLASGEEFKTIIDVEYIVNPQLSENFYDEVGKEIKTTKKTNFDFGTTYQPEPENFVSSGNELYMYKGWLKSNEKPGTATPRSGKPSKVTKEDTVHYIYEKSEKQINMTIPTEMVFGTENGKDVTSKEYEVKNNSDKVKTEVSLNEFKKETSEVKLLTSKEKDPTKTTQSARLNLTTNGETAVGSLNDTTKNETITTLNPGEKASMGISGNYFGSQKERARIRYNMMFKFTVIPE